MKQYKCPHCGWLFVANAPPNLVPAHTLEVGAQDREIDCAGVGQVPRGLADKRPLWKDEIAEEQR